MAFIDWIPFVPGVIGGLLNVFSTKSSNDANIQMTRETNEANMRLNERNIEVQRENWAKENAYNHPAAQLARLRQAGINVDGSLIPATGGSMQNANTHPYQLSSPVQALPYGSMFSDALQSVQTVQDIQDMDMQLYKSGIDKITYLKEKYLQVQQMIAELSGKETLNEQERQRLVMLRAESQSIDDKITKEFRAMDDSHKESKKKQKLLDMQSKDVYYSILREDKRLLENIAHMKREDRIAYVNAQTLRYDASTNRVNAGSQRLVARATARKLESEAASIVTRDLNEQNEEQRRRYRWEFEKYTQRLNKDEKEVMLRYMLIELENAEDKNKSAVRHIIEQAFGFDIGGFFQGLGTIFSVLK